MGRDPRRPRRVKMMMLAHLFGETVMRLSDLQRAIPNVSQKRYTFSSLMAAVSRH
jgi:hypothetical protein